PRRPAKRHLARRHVRGAAGATGGGSDVQFCGKPRRDWSADRDGECPPTAGRPCKNSLALMTGTTFWNWGHRKASSGYRTMQENEMDFSHSRDAKGANWLSPPSPSLARRAQGRGPGVSAPRKIPRLDGTSPEWPESP